MASKVISRALRHVSEKKDTSGDEKAILDSFVECVNDESFFTLPQDLAFKIIGAYKGKIDQKLIDHLDSSVKSAYGHRAVRKFRELKNISEAQSMLEDLAAQEDPVAEEEDGDLEGAEEDYGGEEEEDFGDGGITEDDLPEGILRAAWIGDTKEVSKILHKNSDAMKEYYDRIGYPLHVAIFNEKPEMVSYLIKKGADVNQQGALGQRPLHFAAQGESPSIISMLAKAGARLEEKDDEGATPLLAACRHMKAGAVQELIKAGARLNVFDENRDSPLHFACMYDSMEIAKALVDAGAELSVMNKDLKTPFMVACDSGATAIAKMINDKFTASFMSFGSDSD